MELDILLSFESEHLFFIYFFKSDLLNIVQSIIQYGTECNGYVFTYRASGVYLEIHFYRKKKDIHQEQCGGSVVERSSLVFGVFGSILAHAMWALWWTNTVCVGFLGVLPFPLTFFIPPIIPSSSIRPEPKLSKGLK